MKTISNMKLIKRNKTISQIILYTSITVLAIGLILSLSDSSPYQIGYTYLILVPGYILVQLSIYFGNKWGKSPRPDEIINSSLKGLDDKYSLYHYSVGVPHLLLGPPGMWIIKPYQQAGVIKFDEKKGKFIQKGGANIFSKLFGQESIGDILHDSRLQKKDLQKYFQKNNIPLDTEPEIVNVFINEKAVIDVQQAPEFIVPANKLKDFFRRHAKTKAINDLNVKIKEIFPNEDII